MNDSNSKYDVFISYSQKDAHIARNLSEHLSALGVNVFSPFSLRLGYSWFAPISDVISRVSLFVFLLTDNSNKSDGCFKEFMCARERGTKTVIVDAIKDRDTEMLHAPMKDVLRIPYTGEMAVAEKLVGLLEDANKSDMLYERLSEELRCGSDKWVDTVLEIISFVWYRIFTEHNCDISDPAVKTSFEEIHRLMSKLAEYKPTRDGNGAERAKSILSRLENAFDLLGNFDFGDDLFYISMALALTRLDLSVRAAAENVLYGEGAASERLQLSIGGQEKYSAKYKTLVNKKEAYLGLSGEQISFIGECADSIIGKDALLLDAERERSQSQKSDTGHKLLTKAAELILGASGALEELSERTDCTPEYLKCLYAAYERLSSFSGVVGADEVAGKCSEALARIKLKLASLGDGGEGGKNELENSLRSLLGFTRKGMGDYDAFVSFKSEDSDMAKNVYSFLKQNLLEAFWSKVSLPELSEADYEDAIMNALDRSKHMVVVLSDLNYLSAAWVKRELRTFNSEIEEGRKAGANLVFLVTDSVYSEIIRTNKMVLPIQYRKWQMIKFSEYKETLLQYIK